MEQFCLTICKNNKQGVVKKLVRDRPDLISTLTEIAVKGGYTETVRTLHQEKALTTVEKQLFENAISNKHYYTVRYLAENRIRELEYIDLFNAAAFGTVEMMIFLIEQMKLQGKVLTDKTYSKIIRVACISERTDCVETLLAAGHKCDFDANIKSAVVNGHMEMLSILMRYATELSVSAFDEAESLALANDHPHLAFKMREYKRGHPEKFQ